MPDVAELRVKIGASTKEAENALKGIDAQLKGVATTSKDMGGKVKSGTGEAGSGFMDMLGKVGQVTSSITFFTHVAGQVIDVMKQIYATAREGAELEYAAQRFDRLAIAAGTTSDVLLDKLRVAVKGTISDAEIMAQSGDLMALGLANSSDEIIRMTTVAAGLNMPMNQLVLALTNMTTMRFDQLGVRVEGFDKKLQALTATGMDAQDAFTEAFLQQAEEQLKTVGNAADEDIGSFKRLEAAINNLGDSAKKSLSGEVAPAVDDLAETINEFAARGTIADEFRDLNEQLKTAGVNTREFTKAFELGGRASGTYAGYLYNVNDLLTAMSIIEQDVSDGTYDLSGVVDQYGYSVLSVGEKTQAWADANYDTGASYVELKTNIEDTIPAIKDFTDAQLDQINTITSLGKNFGDIISYAKEYDKNQEEIHAKEIERQDLIKQGFSKTSDEVKALDDEISTMKKNAMQEMTDLANQMTLNMFQATIAIDGITQGEAEAYFQMAVDMGLISEEAAQSAMTAYGNAVDTINDYVLDDKQQNVNVDLTAAMIAFDFLENYQLLDKEQRIFVRTYYETGQMTQNWAESNYDYGYSYNGRPIGGPVYPGNAYLWQEPGREGELLMPSQYGRVMSQTELAQVLREALSGRGGGSNAQPITNVNNYYYNLTMPTSNRPEEVATAFELLKAYGEAL